MTTLHSWRELAACRNAATAHYDPFFDETEQGERAAIAICRICRVQGECLPMRSAPASPTACGGASRSACCAA